MEIFLVKELNDFNSIENFDYFFRPVISDWGKPKNLFLHIIHKNLNNRHHNNDTRRCNHSYRLNKNTYKNSSNNYISYTLNSPIR